MERKLSFCPAAVQFIDIIKLQIRYVRNGMVWCYLLALRSNMVLLLISPSNCLFMSIGIGSIFASSH
jgi:hypothetical protein